MMKDAEAHAEEDRKRKETVEARNQADQLVYQVDKTLKDLGDKVDQGEIDKANEAKEKLKKKRSKVTTSTKSKRPAKS